MKFIIVEGKHKWLQIWMGTMLFHTLPKLPNRSLFCWIPLLLKREKERDTIKMCIMKARPWCVHTHWNNLKTTQISWCFSFSFFPKRSIIEVQTVYCNTQHAMCWRRIIPKTPASATIVWRIEPEYLLVNTLMIRYCASWRNLWIKSFKDGDLLLFTFIKEFYDNKCCSKFQFDNIFNFRHRVMTQCFLLYSYTMH